MSVNEEILTLKATIRKSCSVLERLENYYHEYLVTELNRDEARKSDAIVIADILVNYYTCLETMFHRISQFFENNLQGDRWHRDLLDTMTLHVEGVRKAVISDESHALLVEFLKFRHFKRYYFELDYDWDKLEFLQKKFKQLQLLVKRDIESFLVFLDKLREG
jgi:hypothetical protein